MINLLLFISACNKLKNKHNYTVNVNDTSFNATAIFKCYPGYIIDGTTNTSLTVTCNATGFWSKQPPTCVKKGMYLCISFCLSLV